MGNFEKFESEDSFGKNLSENKDLVDLDHLLHLFKDLKKTNIRDLEYVVRKDHTRQGTTLIEVRLLIPILESDGLIRKDGDYWSVTGDGLRFGGYLKDHLRKEMEKQEVLDVKQSKTLEKEHVMNKNKIFVSHSSKDIGIVKSFVDNILILGLGVPRERIFCSSMEGHGVSSGQYIPDRLKEEVNSSCLALLFVSKNYKESEVCLNEVGAAWAVLSKERIIPFVLPDVSFSDLGFLDIGRLGLRIDKRNGVIKFVQDCRDILNPDFDLGKLTVKIDDYLNEIGSFSEMLNSDEHEDEEADEVSEWTECFTNNLYALNDIIRKAIPEKDDGVHQISNVRDRNQILSDLSKAKFLKRFWYKYAGGDYYVEKLKKLPSGNWLMSGFNWEMKVTDMWVSMNTDLQYEFVLIKSEKLDPFTIHSDVGGTDYTVGVLPDGTIVSENERTNGYAKINGETVDLNEIGVEPRARKRESNWILLVSDYHKFGYNPNDAFDLCKKLDKGELEVSEEVMIGAQRNLRNHPTVIMHY